MLGERAGDVERGGGAGSGGAGHGGVLHGGGRGAHGLGGLSKTQLVALLTSVGEKFSHEELERCLEALTGESDPDLGGAAGAALDPLHFAEEVLGLTTVDVEGVGETEAATGLSTLIEKNFPV